MTERVGASPDVAVEVARPAFEQSSFSPATGAAPASSSMGRPDPIGYPTMAELLRPTNAVVVNITNGQRTPLNPGQMSDDQGVSFVQQKLAALGFAGSLTPSNQSAPTVGPFGIDYAGDDRRHWDIGGMNVGLVLQLYATNPPEVADRMLACDMKYASTRPVGDDDAAPLPHAAPPALRAQPGVDLGLALRRAPVLTGLPSLAELERPTDAVVVNITTGQRTPLNPLQMSTDDGVAFVEARLAALRYGGPGVVSNQTAPTVGPFGIDYGTDDRRHWDIDGMNVGLTLQLYATNPPEIADRMLAAMLHPRS